MGARETRRADVVSPLRDLEGSPFVHVVNLSSEPLGKLHSWLPHDFVGETVVFLPDACPGKSPLPTGVAALTRQADWRRFAVSDCGCGMRLMRSSVPSGGVTQSRWDELAARLQSNKGRLGDLGGGNHFLDALEPYDSGPMHFLVHTGSRHESGHVDALVDRPDAFDAEFDRVVSWAEENRRQIHREIEAVFGRCELVLDLPHNTYERLADGGAIIRKGSVHLRPGALSIIPSHMSGDVVLVRATDRVAETLFSMSHGTGRRMSRGDCKPLADRFDFAELRRQVLMPTCLADASLRTEGPYAYRELDECLALIDGYVTEESRFAVVAYMGHL
ncbi:MAG: RtcB family protein [Phycisphaerae bacterium]|nr:RtcB family protein [Phycisphaerae bacterium]